MIMKSDTIAEKLIKYLKNVDIFFQLKTFFNG